MNYEHIIIYFERTFLVINVIKYLIKGGSYSKQAWVTQTCFGLTQGEWLMGTHGEWHLSCQGGDSAGTPRHMLPWNYKSKHQFDTFLITTKKLKMNFFSYPVTKRASNWPKFNYSTVRVLTIMLCFILIYLFAKSHRLGCLGTSPIKSAVILTCFGLTQGEWLMGTHGDTWGVTHGDTWSSGTRSCQGVDSAGTPRHMLPWNSNPNINLVQTLS